MCCFMWACFVLMLRRMIGSGDIPATAETKNMIDVVIVQDSASKRDSMMLILCNNTTQVDLGSDILRGRG